MDIRLPRPDPNLRQHIIDAAKSGGCYANIKYKRYKSPGFHYHSTFTLEKFPNGPQASFEVQDAVIGLILAAYPDATIRTARAIYESLDDFTAQKAARVT